MTFISPTHPDAFKGMSKRKPTKALPHECPKCKGHGGWHLKLNAYGHGLHFDASCNNCNGWGYVEYNDNHIHEWSNGTTIGKCLHQYTCKICGQQNIIDSSD